MNINKALKKLKGFSAEIAIFCGSGLLEMINLENSVCVDYKALGFDFENVYGHRRCLEFGTFAGKKVVVASRFHYYENASTDNLFGLFQILSKLGVTTVIATTSVGAINPDFDAGDIMLVKDHINFSGTNPLFGKKPLEFVDLSNSYNKTLRKQAQSIAKKYKIQLFDGVHLQAMGPTYETAAEVRFFRTIGADTVSMSLAHDSICAAYFDMKFVAFASIANKALQEGGMPLCHEDVVKVAQNTTAKLGKIISKLIEKQE